MMVSILVVKLSTFGIFYSYIDFAISCLNGKSGLIRSMKPCLLLPPLRPRGSSRSLVVLLWIIVTVFEFEHMGAVHKLRQQFFLAFFEPSLPKWQSYFTLTG